MLFFGVRYLLILACLALLENGSAEECSTFKVYVGSLSWNTTDDTLRQAFEAYGTVKEALVMRDRDTGRSRGFGFVTFSSAAEAEAAISALDGQDLDGRKIKVNCSNAMGGGGGTRGGDSGNPHGGVGGRYGYHPSSDGGAGGGYGGDSGGGGYGGQGGGGGGYRLASGYNDDDD